MRQTITSLFIIIIMTLLLASCREKHNEKQVESLVADSSQKEIFEFPIKKFSLPYNTTLSTDSNSLIYLKHVPFDTSYLLHIVKQGLQIQGVCYVVLPTFHRDFEDFHDEQHELLFFDGFSFKLDNMQWQTVKQKSNDLIANLSDKIRSSSPCVDCSSYSLFFNNEERVSHNKEERDKFKEYDDLIRDKILYFFYSKKIR